MASHPPISPSKMTRVDKGGISFLPLATKPKPPPASQPAPSTIPSAPPQAPKNPTPADLASVASYATSTSSLNPPPTTTAQSVSLSTPTSPGRQSSLPPPKLALNQHLPDRPASCNGFHNKISKSVQPKNPLELNQLEKITNISTDVQVAPKTTDLSTTLRVSTPSKSDIAHDADLSRESNQTTDYDFAHKIEFMEHRIQQLQQTMKLMENENSESEIMRQVDEAQLIWDKEFESGKKDENDGIITVSSEENHQAYNSFELQVKSLELKELENQLILTELENQLLKDKIDEIQSDYQTRDEVLMNEFERLRMTNAEWAQIGHNFESLIEIERREKEELENRFQVELRQNNLEPNFEINTLKYQLIKSDNRSELLEEQVGELLEKSKNLERQLLAEKSQKNHLSRDLELAKSNVKNLSDQMHVLTTALSEHSGEGDNQRSSSQEILHARSILAQKEVEIAILKATLSLPSQSQQQQQSAHQQPPNLLQPPAPARKGGKKKTGALSPTAQPALIQSGAGHERENGVDNDAIVDQPSDRNELPGDDPIRQITSDHWVSIGVVAKKISRNRKNNSSHSPVIDPTTKQIDAPLIENPVPNDQDPLPPKKKNEKSKNYSAVGPSKQLDSPHDRQKDLDPPTDVDSNYQPEQQPIQAKKVTKSRSKTVQAPANEDDESIDDKDDNNDKAAKRKVSSKPTRKGKAVKSKNAEPVNNHNDAESTETNQINDQVDNAAEGRGASTTIDHQPVAMNDLRLPMMNTNGERRPEGSSRKDVQVSVNIRKKKSSFQIFKPTTPPSSPQNSSAKQILLENSSPKKIPTENPSPKKINKKKSSDKLKKAQVDGSKEDASNSKHRTEDADVITDKVKKTKNKVKAKGKDKSRAKETEKEDEEEDAEEEKEEEEKQRKKEKGERKVKEKKSKTKKSDKVKVKEKANKEMGDADDSVEHDNVSDDDRDQDESITHEPTTRTKRKKRDTESKKNRKKSGDKIHDRDSLVIENQSLENKGEDQDDDGDNSLNKKKKRKIFHLKQKNLNWSHEDENNMLGLPPELSPIKKSTNNTLGVFKEKKKISSANILPPSFLK